MNEECETCVNYGFYKMLQGVYGYYGEMPCLHCNRYQKKTDRYVRSEDREQCFGKTRPTP